MKKLILILLTLTVMLCMFACTEGIVEAPTETEVPTTDYTETETDTEAVKPTETESAEAPSETESTETPSESESAETPSDSESAETPTETETETETESETETETESDTEDMDKNNNVSVGVYDKYDLDTYMRPIWEGGIVHNETVMFVGMDDKAPLLYTPDKIISVRSYDLTIEYIEGVDYKLEDGKLVLLEGTRIPVCPLETYYSVHNNMPYLSTMYNGVVTQTMFGEGDAMCRWQVAVTYKHSDTWGGAKVQSYRDTYADFIAKLENGEDVTVFFYGDSITTGANASGGIGVGPYTPIWPVMFCQYVAKQYGYTVKYVNSYSDSMLTSGKPAGGVMRDDSVYGTNGVITYVNTAVGGWSTGQGNSNFDTYVNRYIEEYGCDLFVLAFGMNNGGSTANEVCNLLKSIIDKTVASAPKTDIVLVSTMIPNPEAVRNPNDTFFCNGNQSTFEAEMYVLSSTLKNKFNIDVEIAPMTSISSYIHSQKRFRDTTGNNVNHPSDFIVRAYAQSIYQTVFGFENLPDNTVEVDGTPVVDANYNAMIQTPGANLYLDGIYDTANQNDAVCVRLEETSGGYFMYHISNGKKIYVNKNADGEIEYSETALTVWVYNEASQTMESADGAGQPIKLVAPAICYHNAIADGEMHSIVACVRCGVEEKHEEHNIRSVSEEKEDGSVEYKTYCSSCGYVLSLSIQQAGVNVLLDATQINDKANSSSMINYSELIKDEDGEYARIHGGKDIDYNQLMLFSDSTASTLTGKYLVMKFRVGENNRGQTVVKMYVGTKNTSPTNENEALNIAGTGSGIEDGLWHTIIVDMSLMTKNDAFVASEDGQYYAKFIAIRPLYVGGKTDTVEDYMDIAFMATCDTLESAESLISGNTYEYYTTSNIGTVQTITE
ncbi:MAG: SGNH/GDSL hydrolase family protein [Eubacteriales bacterium]